MAKLFKFEKVLQTTLKSFDAKDVPYETATRIFFNEPYDVIKYSYSINNFKENIVKYEFHEIDDNNYVRYTFNVGKRRYIGIIKSIDYTVVSSLFNKFLEVNGIVEINK